MMFASDLDRTLIYSLKARATFNEIERNDVVPVEKKDEQMIAYMTTKSYAALKEISAQLLFVPVTTRTFAQFQRIFIFHHDIPITYAVTTNGAHIVYNGQPVAEWEDLIRNEVRGTCASKEELFNHLRSYKISGERKIAEDLFFYYLLDQPLVKGGKEALSHLASEYGWKVSLQGRKLYFVPTPVCKGRAVQYIQEREGIDRVFGAGDSLLDEQLLNVSTHPFVPKHGEILETVLFTDNCYITKQLGMEAGEEILTTILNSLKNGDLVSPSVNILTK